MIIYRIKNIKTGLYSCGGYGSARWSKAGKIWKNIGHVKSHLNNVVPRKSYMSNDVENWFLESYELKESLISSTGIKSFIQEIENREKEKQQNIEEQRERKEILRTRTLKKLSKEEKEALGIHE
jgi:hypothetical protein